MSEREWLMTAEERADFRVRDEQCPVWMSERLIGDSACLMPMPCADHAHLVSPRGRAASERTAQ